MKQKAKILIEYEGKLLLLRPIKKKKRTLIGGTVDPGESPFKTVIREAFEEAGISLNQEDLTTYSWCFTRINKKPVLFHCFLIRGENFLYELKEHYKFQQLNWVPLKKGMKKLRGVERRMAHKLVREHITNNMNVSIGA